MKKLILALMLIAILMAGCEETEKRPVYGQGEPPADYQKLFGNGNGARLDYVQNTAIKQLSERIAKLEVAGRDHSKCKLNKTGLCLTIDGCKFSSPKEVAK